MEERKLWASSIIAMRQHAVFECLAHNLCLLIEQEMKRMDLCDEVEEQKSSVRGPSRINHEGRPMSKRENFIGTAVASATQGTVRLIRWLQAALYMP